MVPTAFQMVRGRAYSRKSGRHTIRMRYHGGMYLVTYGREGTAYASYNSALQHVIKLLLTTNNGG